MSVMWGKRKEGQSKQEKKPQGRKFGRRRLFKWAIGASVTTIIAADTNAPEAAANAALSGFINAREPVPAELQTPTKVREGKTRVTVGLGNSNMAGQGDRGIPLDQRVAKDATDRGIPMIAVSEAENGSLSTAVPQQARRAKGRIPKGTDAKDVGVDVWTGENDIKGDTLLVRALKRLARDPLDFASWRTFFTRRKQIRGELQTSIKRNAKAAADELGTKSVTLYGLSPVQYAQQIVEVDPRTGKATTVPVADAKPSIQARINQAVAADLVRQGTKAVIGATQDLRNEGYDANMVDSAAEIQPSDYDTPQHDQHFGPRAAKRIAQRRARQFRE